MAEAKQVAEFLGFEEDTLSSVVPETLFKDGQGPLSDLVDTLLEKETKVKELSDAVEFQKSEAKKAFDVRDQLKTKVRELEVNGVKDDELKSQYQEATKTLATLEEEKKRLTDELEGHRSFKESWEANTKSQIDALIKENQVPKAVAEMVRRMDLGDQLPFLQATYANSGNVNNGKTPFAGKKVGGSGQPFEGFISEDDYERNKANKEWRVENREKINKSMAHW